MRLREFSMEEGLIYLNPDRGGGGSHPRNFGGDGGAWLVSPNLDPLADKDVIFGTLLKRIRRTFFKLKTFRT